MSENVGYCWILLDNVRKCRILLDNVGKCREMSENVRKCRIMLGEVLEVSESVRGRQVSGSVGSCWKGL